MNPLRLRLIVAAIFILTGGFGWIESSAQAQVKVGDFATSYEVSHYVVQIEYQYRSYCYYCGGYGNKVRYSYVWVNVADSTNLKEAEFIYDLYRLAWELGVLGEVAPKYGYNSFPMRVRMITEYQTVDPVLTSR